MAKTRLADIADASECVFFFNVCLGLLACTICENGDQYYWLFLHSPPFLLLFLNSVPLFYFYIE